MDLKNRVRNQPWGLLFLLCTGIGVFLFLYRSLDDLARRHPVDWTGRFVEEMTGSYGILLLMPLVFWLTMRYPIAGHARQRLLLYVGSGVVYGLCHTTFLYGTRLVLWALMGRGVYDYGVLRVRYAMELPLQLISFSIQVSAMTFLEIRRQARERLARVEALEKELAQAQLTTLQLQLQPHFLFNALNAISALLHEDPKAADRMLGRLADFLRRVLASDKSVEVPLREELDLVRLYLDVMKARFEERLNCEVDCAEDTADALVPQLILQPLVENAIRHGVDPASGRVSVSVEARRNQGELELRVSDSGTGAARGNGSGFGVGLKNAGARLDRLYGAAAELKLESGPQNTLVRITLPFHTKPV